MSDPIPAGDAMSQHQVEAVARAMCKPKTIEVGRCYRLSAWYGLGKPSDTIVYVHAIEGKRQRTVHVRSIDPQHELGWNCDSYTGFLRRIHSEVQHVIN